MALCCGCPGWIAPKGVWKMDRMAMAISTFDVQKEKRRKEELFADISRGRRCRIASRDFRRHRKKRAKGKWMAAFITPAFVAPALHKRPPTPSTSHNHHNHTTPPPPIDYIFNYFASPGSNVMGILRVEVRYELPALASPRLQNIMHMHSTCVWSSHRT